VDGAPEAVLAGGRYDDLLGRYGRPSPAVGFAVDVEGAAGALESPVTAARTTDGASAEPLALDGAGGVLVVGAAAPAARLAVAMRRDGRRAAVDSVGLSGDALDAYARRWGFSQVVRVDGRNGRKGAPSPSAPQKAGGNRRANVNANENEKQKED
jgi:ATP phosphoribosyltransferase regulatory subunit